MQMSLGFPLPSKAIALTIPCKEVTFLKTWPRPWETTPGNAVAATVAVAMSREDPTEMTSPSLTGSVLHPAFAKVQAEGELDPILFLL